MLFPVWSMRNKRKRKQKDQESPVLLFFWNHKLLVYTYSWLWLTLKGLVYCFLRISFSFSLLKLSHAFSGLNNGFFFFFIYGITSIKAVHFCEHKCYPLFGCWKNRGRDRRASSYVNCYFVYRDSLEKYCGFFFLFLFCKRIF